MLLQPSLQTLALNLINKSFCDIKQHWKKGVSWFNNMEQVFVCCFTLLSRLWRSLVEPFRLSARLSVSSPFRQKIWRILKQLPSFTSPAFCDFALIISSILNNGLSLIKKSALKPSWINIVWNHFHYWLYNRIFTAVCHLVWDILHNVVPDNVTMSRKLLRWPLSEDVIHITANNSFSVLKIHVKCKMS